MSDETWHIVGAGALGTLFALHLREAGLTAQLLHHHRPNQRTIMREGEKWEFAIGSFHDLAPGTIKRALLCTKAPQVPEVLTQLQAQLQGALADGAVVIAVANGMGFEDCPAAKTLRGGLLRAITTAGAYRDDRGVIHAVNRGTTRVGHPGTSGDTPPWFASSLGRVDGWQWDPRIDAAIGQKFAINCAVNPLTAVLQCRNGELVSNTAYRQQLKSLCAELEPALRELQLWQGSSLFDTVVDVCVATAANRSSMLQDVLADRPTEIDYLNGALLARLPGAALPMNKQLVMALR